MVLSNFLYRLINLARFQFKNQEELDRIKTNQGLIYFNSRNIDPELPFNSNGFSVFSQFDEDGLINALIKGFDNISKNFIEFGVDDFKEANCRFLTESLSWKGAIFEGNKQAFLRMSVKDYYWKKNLSVFNKFLDVNNIQNTLSKSNFKENLGILSVDVDGNDWYLLKESLIFNPSIIIVEYNSLFGFKYPVSIPYDPKFNRSKAHKSCLYYGASLKAFEYLLTNRGYKLVGTNAGGNNAFFVKEKTFKFKNWITEHKIEHQKCIFNESQIKDVNVKDKQSLPQDLLDLPLNLVDTKKTTTLKEILF
jgi:hypothetical protein